MRFKLYEEYSTSQARDAYEALNGKFTSSQLSRMGLGASSNDYDVRRVYYQECKEDSSLITPKLVPYLCEQAVDSRDIPFFEQLAKDYHMWIVSMATVFSLFHSIAFREDVKFARKLLEVIQRGEDGKDRLKELVKKYSPDPARVNSQSVWGLKFFFDEGLIVTDGSLKYPFNVSIASVYTELITHMGQNAQIDKYTIPAICRQNVHKGINKRVELFVSLPPLWEYLKKHPDEIDSEMGFKTFGDYMPEEKRREINHIRRGRLKGRDFGF